MDEGVDDEDAAVMAQVILMIKARHCVARSAGNGRQ